MGAGRVIQNCTPCGHNGQNINTAHKDMGNKSGATSS